MNFIKLLAAGVMLTTLSACGTGEFFIKRAVNSLEKDVASELKNYADFDSEQEQQIDQIAAEVNQWVRTQTLPTLAGELEKMANDIESNSRISPTTWATTVAFLERPLTLSDQTDAVTKIADLVHGVSAEQAAQAIKKLENEHKATLKDQNKETLKKQNKKMTRALKIVFAELGAKPSKQRMKGARAIIDKRKSHIALDHAATEKDHQTFIGLVNNRQAPREQYIAEFTAAWRVAELGARHQQPELWEHNAQVAYEAMNYLLKDLSQAKRESAAQKIREYAELFTELSKP